MKQKLGLCCALVHDPDLLILDEPTTGVDPLSRRQFWELIDRIRASRPGMSVIVATAYMEEAARFDWLVAMDAGRVLATGTPPTCWPHRRGHARGRLHRPAARGKAARSPRRRNHAARGRRRDRRHRSPRPDHAFRRFRRRRSCQLSHRAGRDLRLPRLQWLRQDHHHEDADRPVAAERGRGLAVRPGGRSQGPRDPPPCRLHVAGLLALRRTDRAAEPGAARAPVPDAGRHDSRPRHRGGRALRAHRHHG